MRDTAAILVGWIERRGSESGHRSKSAASPSPSLPECFMPVAQGSQTGARQAALIALGGIAAFLTLVFLITRLGSLGNDGAEVPIQLGEPVFQAGNAADLAAVIADGEPLLLPDASGGDRDIVINHLGDSPEEGWVAFAARSLTAPRDCFVQWQADRSLFVDSCDGIEYPADGDGLEQYGISVDADGNLVVNLNVVEGTTDGGG